MLVVPGCPGTDLVLQRVQEAAEGLGVETNLRVLTVDREEDAQALGFFGSPTVRVEGRDVEDVAGLAVGLTCRLYDGDCAPPTRAIRRALAAAVAERPASRDR